MIPKPNKTLTLIILILTIFLIPTPTHATTLNPSISTKVINNYTYKQLTHNQAVLKWNKIDDADRYEVYKYNLAKKKYLPYKTLSGNKTSLKVTGLSPAKIYYFKVKAYCDAGVITSKPLEVRTFNKTTGYFYKKVVLDSVWSGIFITNNKATNAQMSRYKVGGQKTAIKYNYSKNDRTLYIHVYAKFAGKGVNQKFAFYKKTSAGWKQYKLSQYTNKQLAMSGIQKYWNIYVKGSSYDFVSGCNFNTKVIFHTDIQQGQNYVTFNMGNEKCYFEALEEYWFFSHGACYVGMNSGISTYNHTGKGAYIALATNHQLKRNDECFPIESTAQYKSTVAHEFGHVLGLDDAYDMTYKGRKIKRISRNTETGYYENGRFKNIMYESHSHAVANDIEMALQGQGMAIRGKAYSFQSYANYYDGCRYKKSLVIRK